MTARSLKDLVDLDALRGVLEAEAELTGMPIGLLDGDGSPLVAHGWQDICSRYHHEQDATQGNCQQAHCQAREQDGMHACHGGLWDLKVPICLEGQRIATLVLGQFLLEGETPEEALFRTRSTGMGFDRKTYIATVSRVPAFPREKIDRIQEHLLTLVRLFLDQGRLRLEGRHGAGPDGPGAMPGGASGPEVESLLSGVPSGLDECSEHAWGLLEAFEDGGLLLGPDSVVLHANLGLARMLGLPQEALNGRSVLDLLGPKAGRSCLEMLVEASRRSCEMDIPGCGGQSLRVRVARLPWRDREGRMGGALLAVRDLTPLRCIEEALRESEARFRSVIDNMQDVFYRTDQAGRITLLSRSAARILGYDSVDELLGMPIPETLYEDPSDHLRFMESLAEKGFVNDFEEILRKKDGNPVLIATNSHFYADGEGNRLGVEGIFFDITERKQAEQALREKEAALRRILEHVRDIIISYDSKGILTYLSESARSLGYPPEFGVGHNVFEFIHPDDHPIVAEAFSLTLQGIAHDRVECRVVHGDGHCEWYEEYSEPMFVDGELVQINGVIRNIQERKRAETSLKESEEMYRALVEHSHDGIFIMSGSRFLFVNARATSIVGYTLDELYAMNLWDLVHPEERERIRENSVRRLRGEEVLPRYNARIVHRNGSILTAELSLSKVQFAGQWAVLGTMRDITERLKAEAALRESEERYRLLVENQGEGVCYVDEHEQILFVNRAAEEIFARSRSQLLGRPLSDFTDAKNFQKVQRETVKRKGGSKSTYEMFFTRPDGERRQVLVTVTPYTDDQEHFRGALGIFRDVTSIKQAESELKRLSTAIEQASDSILVADVLGRILYANPATERLVGLSRRELAKRRIEELSRDEGNGGGLVDSWRIALEGRSGGGRVSLERADGTLGQADTTLSPVRDDDGVVQYVVVTSRDVTREAELETQLRHSQKMEAIGVLAGGIAHDFNNILMPILGFTELAQDRVGDDQPKLAGYLREILNAGRRAADLVRQILIFSRQVEQVKKPVLLHPIVKECLKLMRAAIPVNIPIQAHVDENCGPVLADPSQIHQVVMNLCTNGYHAMREKGGTLQVSLDRQTCAGPVHAIEGDLPPGDYVRLRIIDSGCGMDPETQKKIFLPFFTTKKVGEGTGLGLSIVHGIVSGCGGGIVLESEVTKGSSFTVYLPSAEHLADSNAQENAGPASGTERILVIDDEVPIGQMLGEILDMLGYRVEVFSDSLEALAALRARPEHFDLLLTDYSMPGLTGPELAQMVWEARPGFPVLLMTGYSDDLDEAKTRALGFAGLLRKPLPIQTLARAMRQTLDSAKNGSN